MQKLLFLLIWVVVACACQTPKKRIIGVNDLKQMVDEGQFKKAATQIDSLVQSGSLREKIRQMRFT
ncbi:hypothetical protein [Prolixibacter bellariivorans]|uniref:hypothetical protein n=1 Tax=Prolixibacter bellariivorans TaxID=314319 RepID=UPI00046FFB47|nr:hypothetical protein [Prolixibacter bellariivorans]